MTRRSSHPRFVFLLNRAQKAVQRWVETRPGTWEGVSSAQAALFFFLQSHPNATIGEIAAALQVAPAAVTNLSKRMQAAGLIERTGDERDGRMTRLGLTVAGKEASVQAHGALQELNTHLKAGFTDAELAVVARWLEQAAALDSPSGNEIT
ncbi:MAG: MarR family winged helix-turn-helix transcriptional regulator [Burkholderiaceae bacterium]